MKLRSAGCPELWSVVCRANGGRTLESVTATPNQIDMSLNKYTGTPRDFSSQSLPTAAGQVKRDWGVKWAPRLVCRGQGGGSTCSMHMRSYRDVRRCPRISMREGLWWPQVPLRMNMGRYPRRVGSEPVSGGWPQIIYALTFTLSHDIVRVTPADLWLVGVTSAE